MRHMEGKRRLEPEALTKCARLMRRLSAMNGVKMTRRRIRGDMDEKIMLVVPNLRRVPLLVEAHEAGHRGVDNTYNQLALAGYRWPGMRDNVRNYVQRCLIGRAHAAGMNGKGLWVGWGI